MAEVPPHEQARAQFSPAAVRMLGATLTGVLKAQGFASAEILSRWADIVGAEIAASQRADEDQLAAGPGRGHAGTGHAGAAGRGPGRARNPASVGRHPGTGQPLLRLAGDRPHRAAPGALAPRDAQKPPAPPDPAVAARIAESLPGSRTTTCARRSAGSAPPSNESESRGRLGETARHCHNCPVQLGQSARKADRSPGVSLPINRREFCQRTAAVMLATAMLGAVPLSFARPPRPTRSRSTT